MSQTEYVSDPDHSKDRNLQPMRVLMFPIIWLIGFIGISKQEFYDATATERAGLIRRVLGALCGSTMAFIAMNAGLSLAFGDDLSEVLRILTSSFVAAALLLFDLNFIASGLDDDGEDEANKERLTDHKARRSPWTLPFRLLLSMAFATTLIVLIKTSIFQEDIRTYQRDVVQTPANAAITAEHTERANEREALKRETLDQIDNEIAEARSERMSLDQFENAAAADLAATRSTTADLQRELSAVELDLEQAKQQRDAELRGQRLNGSSGISGRGPRYLFWSSEVERLEARAKILRQRIAENREEIALLRQSSLDETAEQQARADALRATLDAMLVDLNARRSMVFDEVEALANGKNDWIKAQVEADPEYLPLPMTLSDQIGALEKVITKDPLTTIFSVFLTLLLLSLDCAAVIAHATGSRLRGVTLQSWCDRERGIIETSTDMHSVLLQRTKNQIERRKAQDELFTAEASSAAFAAASQYSFNFSPSTH